MSRYKPGIFSFILECIVKLLYFASLTSLIPFGALLLTSSPAQIVIELHSLPVAALALLALSIAILFMYHWSLAHTLASLGWMTLLPGIGSLFFMVFRQDAVFALLARIAGFSKIEPVIAAYLNSALPKLWIFIISYVLLGIILIYAAGKLDREHTIKSYFKRTFGPGARIFRMR